MSDFWVFGYGSLMWNPGFPHVDSCKAVMHGVHRSLCVHSYVHRGTEARPGLVLGLDRGGSCHGVAFKVNAKDGGEVIAYLRERELVTRVYLEKWRPARLENGERVNALVYLVDRTHGQYAGKLGHTEVGTIVRQGMGRSGHNLDYVLNTLKRLRELDIHDPQLEAVGAWLDETKAAPADQTATPPG